MANPNTKYILATIGLLLLGIAYAAYAYQDELMHKFFPLQNTEVHVHSDFSFYINDMKVDLTSEKYQSSTESIKHPKMHFHDGVDTMIHRHGDGITLAEFMQSLGYTLTNTCVTTDTASSYCTDETNSLALYVNNRPVKDIGSYIPAEEDRILLYYGNPQSPNISSYQNNITDEACMYSGNCPERGEPPFESCGITCEI
jgi:hypothetical protein